MLNDFYNSNVWNWSLLCKPAGATANKHAPGHQAMLTIKKKENIVQVQVKDFY